MLAKSKQNGPAMRCRLNRSSSSLVAGVCGTPLFSSAHGKSNRSIFTSGKRLGSRKPKRTDNKTRYWHVARIYRHMIVNADRLASPAIDEALLVPQPAAAATVRCPKPVPPRQPATKDHGPHTRLQGAQCHGNPQTTKSGVAVMVAGSCGGRPHKLDGCPGPPTSQILRSLCGQGRFPRHGALGCSAAAIVGRERCC